MTNKVDRLRRLREKFLAASSGQVPGGSYWQDLEDLALYDATFGKRIVWKWDAVFQELKSLGFPTPTGRIFDFGCGSGAVGESIVNNFENLSPECFALWDHSPLALEFACTKLKKLSPQVWKPELETEWDWVFVSHVLNELSASDTTKLLHILRRSRYGVIVEPGTMKDFKNLVAVRSALLEDFEILAPCTHSLRCPLAESEKDWCHHFAKPPSEIFADPEWAKFREQAGVDLSTLPYTYLVFRNKKVGDFQKKNLENLNRVIGSPRIYKGYAKILSCHKTEGVREIRLQKRDDPAAFKSLKKGNFPPLF